MSFLKSLYRTQELLALGEQIGSVGSGLSDDYILEHLKTRVFTTPISSEPVDNQELNSCVICQVFHALQFCFCIFRFYMLLGS